jgi:hypothetical protein
MASQPVYGCWVHETLFRQNHSDEEPANRGYGELAQEQARRDDWNAERYGTFCTIMIPAHEPKDSDRRHH